MPADDPAFRFRVTAYYGEAVQPPQISGELAEQVGCVSDFGVDTTVMGLTGRPDIGQIVIEERLTDDVAMEGPRAGWRNTRTWTRAAAESGHCGWSHS